MSSVSMQSSNPTSLIETKKQIISKHLKKLNLATFKKALCKLKPSRGAGPIKMRDLTFETFEELVEFIFKCHTEKHGTQTVRKALKKMNENQTKMLIDKDLREEIQRRKSMEPKKNEASTSKVIVDEQDGKRVHPSAPKKVMFLNDDVPRSEPSAKKIRRELDRDAVLRVPKSKETNARKNEGPAGNPPKPDSTNKISNMAPNKPVKVTLFTASAKQTPRLQKAPPTISMEEKKSNIIVTHLKSLKGDIKKFKEILCSEEPPIKGGQIQMRDIEDKSLEEMVDFIIRRHTLRRGPATVIKVLEHMNENQIKMKIQKDMRKLCRQEEEKARDQ